jgi:curli biogenesis system outer membrane secretion channel CsgG
MKFLRPIVLIITMFCMVNLYSQDVESFILKAPEKPFYSIKKIGVLEFECTNNRGMNTVITNFIVSDLLDQYRGIYDKESKYWGLKKGKEGQTFVKGVKTDFYQIIERDQLKKILKEQRLSLSGAIDESSAAEVGRVLGLDLILMGNVSYSSVDEKGSSLLGLASSSGSNCLTRKVNAKGTLKMVSVQTAQIVGTKSAETELKIYKCDDQRSGIPKPEVMAETCMKQIAREFTDYFAPGYQYIEYEFEKIKLKEFKSKGKEAMGFVEKGDLDRAFPIVYAMFEADSYNPKAAYNLGILYEMVGSYIDAFEYYGIAYELDYTNDRYAQATKRAKAGVGLNEYLEDIGRPVKPYTFTGGGVADVLADRLQVRGSSSERIEVYELPDKSSEVVAKVPGGLEFMVIEKNGQYYKVQLRGTKTGYIHKSDLK